MGCRMALDRKARTGTRVVRREGAARPQEVKVDICVVGAGASGISAAIEAARTGRSVALVDGQPALGGQAVNSVIGAFVGLFSNGPKAYQLTHGIADDILRDLGAQGALHYRRNPEHTVVVMYDEVALGRWVEQAVLKAGVKPITGAILRGVKRDGRRIRELELATRFGDVRLSATGFVDASGDAALAWQAGLPCREADEGPVYGTQMLVLEGIDEANLPTREELAERQKQVVGKYGLVREDGFAFAFPGRGTALVNMTHVETPLDPVAITTNAIEGKAQADKVVHMLQSEYPQAFGKARVRVYGALGIRQTRWIVGRHHLTADEVRSGKKFSDAIARTSWPIELHEREGYVWEQFGLDHIHYVPLGSLIPPDADNLVAAGRCIDGDTAALSSVRVMGPCIAMGAAAAHALDLAGSGSVHQIDNAALQARLKDNLTRVE